VLLARQSAAITLQFILCGAVRESGPSERSKFVNVSQMRAERCLVPQGRGIMGQGAPSPCKKPKTNQKKKGLTAEPKAKQTKVARHKKMSEEREFSS